MQAVCRGYWQNYQTDSEFVLEVTEIHEDVTLLRSSLEDDPNVVQSTSQSLKQQRFQPGGAADRSGMAGRSEP